MILKLSQTNLCYAKFCCDYQICSVSVPELCADTENKKADEHFGLKECIKGNRSKG
jgi:hypothetical protein